MVETESQRRGSERGEAVSCKLCDGEAAGARVCAGFGEYWMVLAGIGGRC
jgi:hypothetical protein